jgi:hypothetical protein
MRYHSYSSMLSERRLVPVKNTPEIRPMLFGILALALQAIAVMVEAVLLSRERAQGWTYGHPIIFEFQNLASTLGLLLCGSVVMAISGLIFDARRIFSFIALFIFFALVTVIGGMYGIG